MQVKDHLMRVKRLWKAFREDCRANVAIVFCFCLPLVVGGAGFGAETGYWYYKRLELQNAADAGAYAAAIEARAGSSTSAMASAALAAAADNGFDPASVAVKINYPFAAPAGTTSVQVVLSHPEPRFFSQIFASDTVLVRTAAVASFNTSANACILALDPTASKAALFSGSSNLSLAGCNVMANSVAPDAITVQGSALLTAPCLMSGGGAVLTNKVTLTSCKTALTNLPKAADPFANLPSPSVGGKCNSSKGATLQPGTYCGGLNLSGKVTLSPGTYVIDGGSLKINANADITGSGVTFYLTGSATADFNGNATVNLSAPTSGTYSGMLVFADKMNSAASGHKFNGTASSKMTGTIYSPSQDVNYLGNFSGQNGCTQIVAKTVQWNGNTSMAINCAAFGMQNIPITSIVALSG
jgi:Flp pilus assembly protein TadG